MKLARSTSLLITFLLVHSNAQVSDENSTSDNTGSGIFGQIFGAIGDGGGDPAQIAETVTGAVQEAIGNATSGGVAEAVSGAVQEAIGNATVSEVVQDAIEEQVAGAATGVVQGAIENVTGTGIVSEAVTGVVQEVIEDGVAGAGQVVQDAIENSTSPGDFAETVSGAVQDAIEDAVETNMKEPDVYIWNTFQEMEGTGGLETIYWYSEATISDGVEFSLFPPNPPGTPEGGFYDIDISPDSMDPMMGTITWTLKDNRGAGHVKLSEGSYDRYYVIFDDQVASASMVSSANLNPKVSVPAYEEKNEIADLFGSGLPFPPVLSNNVILLEVRPGGDMSELEQVIEVEYALLSPDSSMDVTPGVGVVEAWNTFEEVEGTGGLETIYWYSVSSISDDTEFTLFPPNPPGTPEGGFYDIDISIDSDDATKGTITWTLKDNKGAGHVVLGLGSSDRHYIVFDQAIATASLVDGANLNPKVTVPYYEDMSEIADLFGSGLPFPKVLDNKIILLEVRPGGDMTELGQIMKVDFTFEAPIDLPPSEKTDSVEEMEEEEEEEEEEIIDDSSGSSSAVALLTSLLSVVTAGFIV